jgi:hypothetical protein
MAATPDRYADLRQAELAAQKAKTSADGLQITDEKTAQTQSESSPKSNTVSTTVPKSSPGWTGQGGMADHFASARKYHIWANHVGKAKAHARADRAREEEQKNTASPPSAEQEPPRTYEALKSEHNKILEAQKQNSEQTQPHEISPLPVSGQSEDRTSEELTAEPSQPQKIQPQESEMQQEPEHSQAPIPTSKEEEERSEQIQRFKADLERCFDRSGQERGHTR